MDIQQLQYFQALAVTQHMTHASEELNITQPALSSSLSRLENELGLLLFNRSGRQIILNSNGKKFLTHVDIILQQYEEAIQELQKMKESENSVISLLVSGTGFPKNIMKGFCQLNPDITIRQQLALGSHLQAKTLKPDVDFLLTAYPVHFSNCEALDIYEEALYLAVYKKHPLAERSSVSLEELKDETFISLPQGHIFREMAEALCQKAGFQPKIVLECYPGQLSELLDNSLNVTFTIESAVHNKEFGPNIRLIPFSTPGCTRKIQLIYKKNSVLSASAKLFLNYCKNYRLPDFT